MSLIETTTQSKRYAVIADGQCVLSGVLPVGDVLATSHEVVADEDEQAFLAALPADAFPALPSSGWLEAQVIYQYGEQCVIVRQSHNRTIYEPSETPALFSIYRADAAETLAWVAHEPVYVGTLRTYEGVTYRCITAHTTQSDWPPPAAPALWTPVASEPTEPQPWVQPTGAHDAYAKGARVTYSGFTWESTIDANVWAPGVYGWVKV